MRRDRGTGWRSHHPPSNPTSPSPPLSASAPPRPRAQTQRDSNHNLGEEGKIVCSPLKGSLNDAESRCMPVIKKKRRVFSAKF